MSDETKPEDDQPERKSAKPKSAKAKKAKTKKSRGIKSAVRNRSSKTRTPPDAERHTHARARAGKRDLDRREPPPVDSIEELQRKTRKAVLLEHLADTGDEINPAAKALGIGRTTLWEWRKNDPEFNEALEEAYRVGTESLVAVAKSRAVDGWEEPVFQGGEQVGTITKYDHSLLQMLIKKRNPAFRDPKWAVPVTPPRNPGEISLDLDKIESPELLAALEKEARRQVEAMAR